MYPFPCSESISMMQKILERGTVSKSLTHDSHGPGSEIVIYSNKTCTLHICWCRALLCCRHRKALRTMKPISFTNITLLRLVSNVIICTCHWPKNSLRTWCSCFRQYWQWTSCTVIIFRKRNCNFSFSQLMVIVTFLIFRKYKIAYYIIEK